MQWKLFHGLLRLAINIHTLAELLVLDVSLFGATRIYEATGIVGCHGYFFAIHSLVYLFRYGKNYVESG